MRTNQWITVALGTILGTAILIGAACTSGVATQPSGVNVTPVAEGGTTPTSRQEPAPTPTPWSTPQEEQAPITSIADIDPEECNFVHNINACFVGSVASEGVFDQRDFVGLFLKAQHDLAARLAIDPKIVKIASVETVEWPDASLGVPEEGMTYAQVITPGFELVLQAGEEQYTYHASVEHVVYVEGEEAAGMELSEADEVDLVRLSLEWGLVEKNVPDYGLLSDPQNIVLVLEGFETRTVPKLPGANLTLLSKEEVKAKVDAEGDFLYVRLNLYPVTATTAQVEVQTPAAHAGKGFTYRLTFKMLRKASWGISTRPTRRMRFLPSACFSSSLRFRVMSPP